MDHDHSPKEEGPDSYLELSVYEFLNNFYRAEDPEPINAMARMFPPRQLDEIPEPERPDSGRHPDGRDDPLEPSCQGAAIYTPVRKEKKKSKRRRRKKQPVINIDDDDYDYDYEGSDDEDEDEDEGEGVAEGEGEDEGELDEVICTELEDVSGVNWQEMLKTMKCIKCDLLPNPEWRYLCQDGHQYCHGCYEALILNEAGFGLCSARVEMTELDLLKTQPVVFNFRGFTGQYHFERGTKDKSCKEIVKHQPPDPIYTALFNNFKFKCPNSDNGCEEGFRGVEVFNHYDFCPQMKDQAKISGDSEQPEMEMELLTRM